LLVVTNLAHHLDGEDGISARDGCLHAVVAPLPVLPKTADTISISEQRLSQRKWESRTKKGTVDHVLHSILLPHLISVMVSISGMTSLALRQILTYTLALGTTETK